MIYSMRMVKSSLLIFILHFAWYTIPIRSYHSIVGGVQFAYYLDNRNGIDRNLYALIQRHFKRYHLINRYYTKAVQELSNIENYFKFEEITCEDDYDKAASKLIRKTDADAVAYGRNHWKIVMYYDAATSPVFSLI